LKEVEKNIAIINKIAAEKSSKKRKKSLEEI
jgi:hypothetical protein